MPVIPNFTSEMMQEKDVDARKENNIKWAASSIYAGKKFPITLSAKLRSYIPRHRRRRYGRPTFDSLSHENDSRLQSVAAVYVFFLMMVLHPDVQHRAQAEIDSCVGPDRLPTFDDRPHLPYVEAIIKECFRSHAPSQLSAPY